MSFPWHDRAWCEVADLLVADAAQGDRILAPDLFWWCVGEVWRYVPENLDPTKSYDWVVVHKGEMTAIPRAFLEHVVATMTPVLANEVLVVFSTGSGSGGVEPR